MGGVYYARVLASRWVCLLALCSLAACAPERQQSLGPMNVVMVLVDTLRADRLGAYGYPKPTSPFIDSLAERGVLFEQVSSTASQTVPSMVSLWTSAYPSRHGNQYELDRSFKAEKGGRVPDVPIALPVLAELFRARGYATAAVVTNPWMKPDYGFARGFDHYEYLQPASAKDGAFVYGEQVTDHALDLLDQIGDGPFFLHVHYMDAHAPHDPRPEHLAWFTEGLDDMLQLPRDSHPLPVPRSTAEVGAVYDAAVRSVDDSVRELYAGLASRGLASSTLLVLTADHGEELRERGRTGHGHSLFQELIHVPLLFVHPDLTGVPRRVATPVGLVDIFPTLLELAGAEVPASLGGASLAAILREVQPGPGEAARPLFSELAHLKAIRKGSHKVVRSIRGKRAAQAFDLDVDPDELRPVGGTPPWQRELETGLDAFLKDTTPVDRTPNSQGHIDDDPVLVERLRALGYVQ